MSGFRKFLLRGNLIDLAVAFVIGTAFTAIVTALVKDLITPLIAAAGGKPNFGNLSFTVNHSKFAYGDFINALVTFVISAAVVYFLVVVPVGRLLDMLTRKMDLSWARGSGPSPSRAGWGLQGVMGQAAGGFPGPPGSGSGMRQRVTSKPRAPSLPTWWRTCRLTSARRS